MSLDWSPLQRHYEDCLAREGATPRGADWPNARDLEQRFDVQLGVLKAVPALDRLPTLLDLGCGAGLLLDYLTATGRAHGIDYSGMDLSPAVIDVARQRRPQASYCVRDVIADPPAEQSFDVVIMNGVLTERRDISRERMIVLAKSLLVAAYRSARYGVAFNTMSRHVDWERDDLFHWGFDEVAAFLTRDVSRHYAFRADYGLYEFTTFVWRHPQRIDSHPRPEWWKP